MTIRKTTIEDIESLMALKPQPDEKYFKACFERECDIFIISQGEKDVGFTVLNWAPKYTLYRKLGYPEIQDLNVLVDFRQKGLATKLIQHIESIVENTGKSGVGISVGLFKDYGPAQRLYTKLGYLPDGMGITHDREFVTPFQSYAVDDDLCLMMVKEFN